MQKHLFQVFTLICRNCSKQSKHSPPHVTHHATVISGCLQSIMRRTERNVSHIMFLFIANPRDTGRDCQRDKNIVSILL